MDIDFQFRIKLNHEASKHGSSPCIDNAIGSVPEHLRHRFQRDGFIVFEDVLDKHTVQSLNARLEEILRGRYDRGQEPDKRPKLIKGVLKSEPGGTIGPLGFSGNLQNVKVLQVINVHKCDSLFRELATNKTLGKVVGELAGWVKGVRLGQDQIWAKPPGGAPLVFHRDSPYFMFDPPDVMTVWIALDDMDNELGPLEYVRGSHRWGDGRLGSANQFFQANGKSLLQSAAEREGVSDLDIVSMAGLRAGGISVHDGRTWHGSMKNASTTKPRRGLGLHFVPTEIRFTDEARKSRIWKPYVEHAEDAASVMISDDNFPIVWCPG